MKLYSGFVPGVGRVMCWEKNLNAALAKMREYGEVADPKNIEVGNIAEDDVIDSAKVAWIEALERKMMDGVKTTEVMEA